MADDYVRETLRTLRERTGDAYVPLSEVMGLHGYLAGRLDRLEPGPGSAGQNYAYQVAMRKIREIERRWGPGPRCERRDCEAARG